MSTSVINVKIDQKTKKAAQQVAGKLGLTLSGVINGFLKQFVRTRTVTFSVSDKPTPFLIKQLEESRKDVEAGRVSPGFSNAKDAIAWLNRKDDKWNK